MEHLEKLRLDEKLIASLEQILDLNSVSGPGEWRRGEKGDASPPFPMSPDSPESSISPSSQDFQDSAISGEGDYLNIPSEGGIIRYSEELLKEGLPESQTGKKRRGRKPLRPFDPVKKKTEEKDKYWLRAFRSYMKANYAVLRGEMSADDRIFWREHLGMEGKPEKGRK